MNHIFALPQSAQELRNEIRTQVQAQIRTAQGQSEPPKVTILSPDGKTVTITNPVPGEGTITIPARDFMRDLDVPPRAAGIAVAFFVTMAVIIIGLPIARAIGRMIDRKSQQPQIPAQVTAQLTQLTQSVDAIAIEVERISEGQRFTTKLLSEQQKSSKGLPSS